MTPLNTAADQRPSIKLVIVDPDPLAREVLANMVRSDRRFVVAAQAASSVEAFELARHYRPQVLITAAEAVAENRYALAHELSSELPELSIIVMSRGGDEHDDIAALRAGVSAILDKGLDPEVLHTAIEAVCAGQAIVEPSTTMALVEHLRTTPTLGRGFRPIRSNLTNREWEILDYLAIEASTRQIANELYLTEDTIYSHVKSIMRKLRVHSREEAVAATRELYDATTAVA
jgi:DNA-binding NarL/FixJ family response regulator